jgi:hypothetical protein
MPKSKLFIGFKNGKVETMIVTRSQDYETAVDCDYYHEASEGTEKQQLEEWIKSLE